MNAKTRKAGVVGFPISHSLSPVLHGHWLKTYGIDGTYDAVAIRPEAFETEARALLAAGWRGFNATVPHKEAALQLCDQLDPVAERIGAVNTVIARNDGSIFGTNTDAFGFLANLNQEAPAWRCAAGPALVLGAGGAARAVIAALLDEGVPEIRLTNRTREKAERLQTHFDGSITIVDWDERAAACAGVATLVNTTSLGMTGQPALDLPLDDLPKPALVTDIVYAPLETGLLAAARRGGHPVVDGLGMLLHQARPGFEAWFGTKPDVTDALRAAALAVLAARENPAEENPT